ncbi:peptidylprolyl isomerase [Pokkaliibacter sp. MBI-7]|uniref:peptidylprolyl isomerase n=1 Tax=Pokkaliibacter sp. MBI-7 TaxID=3040600 RepID=UPI00244C61A7|nr:peptidylprolyl isomerase [Pokkaliibacter sp. MBI-7]MDH2434278.1 peptidylprolyl isomerase [Pokkaliibacter sp. MBI-7]
MKATTSKRSALRHFRHLFLLGAVITPVCWAASAAKPAQPATAVDRQLDGVAAIVDDDVVLNSELDRRIRMVQQRFKDKQLPPYDQLRHQVLEQLAMERLQLSLAKQRGIRISDNELNAALTKTAAANNMDLLQFKNALEAEGTSFDGFREEVRNTITIQKLQQQAVNSRIHISDSEVKQLMQNPNSAFGSLKFHLHHILIPVPENPSPKQIDDAQAKARQVYEDARKGADFDQLALAYSSSQTALEGGDMGWKSTAELPSIFTDVVPTMGVGDVAGPIRSASGFHIVKLVDRQGAPNTVIEQTHARHILLTPSAIRDEAQTKALADRLRQRISNGEDFAKLAREYTDDLGSKVSGGDLNWVNPGQTVPAFEQAMNQLQPGEVSQPIHTEFGWHIIQVLERRKEDMSKNMLEAEARNILRKRRYEEELQNWLREIQAEAYIDYKY